MARRVRGNRSSHRPGGQGPSRSRKSTLPASEAESASTSQTGEELDTTDSQPVAVDEVAAAAVAATAAPPPAEEAPRRSRRRDRRRTRQRPGDLAARAASESVWVRADLRRIAVVSVVMLSSLAVSWVVFGLVDVLNLY